MSNEELVKYRFSRAKETYDEAILLATGDHWNAVANRLYFADFKRFEKEDIEPFIADVKEFFLELEKLLD